MELHANPQRTEINREKKNYNYGPNFFLSYSLHTFRLKSFKSVNIAECYVNFELDSNIQNRNIRRMYGSIFLLLKMGKKITKPLLKYSENAFSFYLLKNFLKLQCLPKEDQCNNSPKVPKVVRNH